MSDNRSSTAREREPFDLEREPLERPQFPEHDWGGDGSDLSRPVRAHVLEALRPNGAPYPPPVDALKTLGDPRKSNVAKRRKKLGLTQEHLPDLLRMARDRQLYTADSDNDEVWAPMHAFSALEDLDMSNAVPEIIPLFDLEDDWLDSALPEALGTIGAPALEPIRAYLADRTRWGYGHSHATQALEKIATQHPELREQVVVILSGVLRDAETYTEEANTGAMDALVELKAVEALPLIRHAFEIGKIDEMMRGAWGDVLKDLGVEPEEDDPLIVESQQRAEERHEQMFPRAQREELNELLEQFKETNHARAATIMAAPHDPRRAAEQRARKQKNKRKAASAMRKANRHKHK